MFNWNIGTSFRGEQCGSSDSSRCSPLIPIRISFRWKGREVWEASADHLSAGHQTTVIITVTTNTSVRITQTQCWGPHVQSPRGGEEQMTTFSLHTTIAFLIPVAFSYAFELFVLSEGLRPKTWTSWCVSRVFHVYVRVRGGQPFLTLKRYQRISARNCRDSIMLSNQWEKWRGTGERRHVDCTMYACVFFLRRRHFWVWKKCRHFKYYGWLRNAYKRRTYGECYGFPWLRYAHTYNSSYIVFPQQFHLWVFERRGNNLQLKIVHITRDYGSCNYPASVWESKACSKQNFIEINAPTIEWER